MPEEVNNKLPKKPKKKLEKLKRIKKLLVNHDTDLFNSRRNVTTE